MIALRWAAASTIALALLPGCTPPPKPDPAPPAGPTMATPDKIAAARARYQRMPGAVVGVVDAAHDGLAAVSDMDPKTITADDVLHFVDSDTNQTVCQGTLKEVAASGRLFVTYDAEPAIRAPRAGDLCLRLK